MTATNFARNKILDTTFGGGAGAIAYTPPVTWFMGLSTSTPSVSGSNVGEPSSSASYARVPLTNDKTNFSYAAVGVLTNSNQIDWNTSSGSWGVITNVCLYDTLTSGSLWYFTSINPTTIQTATSLFFSASAISITMT